MHRATLASMLVILICPAVACADTPAPVEMPAEIRKGLEGCAKNLVAAQTIEWDVVRTSPMSIAAAKKIVHAGKSANVQRLLRGTTHVTITSQPDLCFFEHVVDQGDRLPSGKPSGTDDTEYSFDGTTHFMHTANSGEAHSLVWATQEELRDLPGEDAAFLIDETYFRCFGISMATVPASIASKSPPHSVILALLNLGAQLTSVDQVAEGEKKLMRLKLQGTDKLSPVDFGWAIDVYPLGTPVEVSNGLYYLDAQNNYELARSEYFDSAGFMVMQIECSNYQQVDARPIRLPKDCTIRAFAPGHNGAIETQVITFKSISTTPIPAKRFTLQDDSPGTYVIEHKSTDHEKVFTVSKNGGLKPQRTEKQ